MHWLTGLCHIFGFRLLNCFRVVTLTTWRRVQKGKALGQLLLESAPKVWPNCRRSPVFRFQRVFGHF